MRWKAKIPENCKIIYPLKIYINVTVVNDKWYFLTFVNQLSSAVLLQSMVFDQFLSPEDLAHGVQKEIINYFTANTMHDQLMKSV